MLDFSDMKHLKYAQRSDITMSKNTQVLGILPNHLCCGIKSVNF